MKVGAAGDAAEHEADRAADHVVGGPSTAQPTISRLETLPRQATEKREQGPASPDTQAHRAMKEEKKDQAAVQRAEMEERKDQSTAQRVVAEEKKDQPAVHRAAVEEKKDQPAVQPAAAEEKKDQPAVQLAAAEEKKDQPAVQLAAAEDKKDQPAVQRAETGENEVQPAVQCCCSCPEEQMQHRPSGTASVLCKSRDEPASADNMNADAAAEHAISAKDTGTPLRPHVRQTLESRMGVDLGGVRVHEGPAAQESAAAMNARAFTHKGDIWLGKGESQDNAKLMAHEVTHVVQQGAAVRRASGPPGHTPANAPHSAKPPAERVLPTEPILLDTGNIVLSAAWQQALADAKGAELVVPVRYQTLAKGTIRIRGLGKDHEIYTPGEQAITLVHPALEPLRSVDIHPVLAFSIRKNVVLGHITQARQKAAKEVPQDPSALHESIRKNANAMGWLGMDVTNLARIQNQFQGGRLTLDISKFHFRLAGIFNGEASFALTGGQVAFSAAATAKVPNLDPISLKIDRSPAGELHGSGSVPLKFKRFTGAITANYKNGQVDVGGTAFYADEKLSGTVSFLVTDAATARGVALEHLGPDAIRDAAEQEPTPQAKRGAKGVAVAGWGTLTFRFNDWLKGAASVVVDDQGHITVIGEIRPDKEVPLMKPKPFSRNLFYFPIQAEYGLPYVGGIGLEASISLDFNAAVGPAKLYDIVASGRYSTDPRIAKEFALSASFNLSAFAELALTAKGAVVLTILRHDIKAGAGVTAKAGLRGYVDAKPIIIGYREKLPPDQGGKGEFYFKGHAEIAAQPYLGLDGFLFIELSTPWWSPISDHTWTWPIGSLEYALPGEFGIGMDVEHVIGSGKVPDVQFGEVSFDRDKFMSDLLDDKVGPKSKGEQKGKSKWKGVEPENPVPPPEPKKVEPPKAAGGPKKRGAGKQTPEQRKASTPEVTKEWKSALADLKTLAESSRSHPLDTSEIDKAIASLKRKHNFKEIRKTQSEQDWILHVEMVGKQGKIPVKRRATAEKPDDRTPEQKQKDLDSAMSEAEALIKEPHATYTTVEAKLPAIQKAYRLTVLELRPLDDIDYDLHGHLNPDKHRKVPIPGDTKEHPIDIQWFKPTAISYPPIRLAPPEDVTAEKKAKGLKNDDHLPLTDLKAIRKSFEVKPDGSKDLGGMTIGLKAPFSEMAKGHPFKADDKVTGNTNKNAMNDRLKAWGYNRYENANPTTDGDHVMEKQLGGPDEVPNVWPLNSSVNQASGSKIRGEIKRIKTQYKINSLKNKWLRPT
ncbi:MAG: DUF4157 domain-containing protein [Acidobacteriia bacterium]|nr:DUF4157 domain-containing protein [Terriglobia bacterium]